ncbi:MAG TPA: chorismate synthase, partial [Dehalococcoidia bacterium]|nr:chorismate synthase [Dehalococcoidia bacterium]
MGNSIGKAFTVTSFGESHGYCVGVIVDGCPAGLAISEQDIQAEVDRRKPGKGAASTSRTEPDRVEIMSGIYDGHTTGAPICLVIRNTDTDSGQYLKNRFLPRPGHADFTAYNKYGGFNDFRGGGRFSGRITAGFVMAGAIARKLLRSVIGTDIVAHTVAIGGIKSGITDIEKVRANIEKNDLRCGDSEAAEEMLRLIEKVRAEGDSLGGVIECVALNVPAGLGEPVFDTLEGDLAKALFAIPAVKGIEFGSGFS